MPVYGKLVRMGYGKTKKDLATFEAFSVAVLELIKLSGETAIAKRKYVSEEGFYGPNSSSEIAYRTAFKLDQKQRHVALSLSLRADRIAAECKVEFSFSNAIHNYDFDQDSIRNIQDALTLVRAACADRLEQDRKNRFNPLYWLKTVIIFILRIPFFVLQASGFKGEKIEETFAAKVFKMIELLFVSYLVWRWGSKLPFLKTLLEKLP